MRNFKNSKLNFPANLYPQLDLTGSENFKLLEAVAYARGGGEVGGQNPPIEDFNRNENFSFGNEPLFFIQRQPKLLLCFSVLSNLLIKS